MPMLTARLLGWLMFIGASIVAARVSIEPATRSGPVAVCASSPSALQTWDSTIVKLLLDAGARVDARNQEGLTPLEIAEKAHNTHLLPALRAAASRAQR